MKNLLLNQIPDNFSKEKHIAIAPHCFEGKENVMNNWFNEIEFIDTFATPDEIIEADKYTADVASFYTKLLGEKFNKINKLNYSYEFWFTIIYPWMIQLIQLIWIRQTTLIKFIDHHKSEKFIVTICQKKIKWNFKDTVDFQKNGANSHMFNYWLYSNIIMELVNKKKVSNLIVVENDNCVPNIKDVNDHQLISNNKFRLVKRKITENFPKSFKSGYGVNLFCSILFSILLRMKKRNKYLSAGINLPIIENPGANFFCDINYFIKTTLPTSIKNAGQLSKKIKLPNSNYIYVSNNLWYSDYSTKIIAAKAREKNVKIIAAQHGGHTYGSALTSQMMLRIELSSDYFITWGWRNQSEYNFNPIVLPSPLLSKLKNKHKESPKEIVLVSTISKIFGTRFQDPPPKFWLEFRKSKIKFLNNLDSITKTKILYRPYFTERFGMQDYSFFSQKFPWLRKFEGDLDKQLLTCQALLLDHPGTTLNKAYAANVPTILIFPKGGFFFSPQSKVYFDEMKSLGLLFHDPVIAANRLNSINAYIGSWWNSGEIQDFRNRWCNEYALTSENWVLDWAKALWKL